MEFFFEGHRAVIAKQLKSAKSQILVAMAYFTDKHLFNILLKRAQEGIKVHVIVRDDEINTTSGIEYVSLKNVGGYFDFNKSIHHKFCVIDALTVLTGSYNWTNQAARNHEDIVLIDGDIQVAAMYMTKFFSIKDPLRPFRRSRLQDFEGARGDTLLDEKRNERRSGILKRMREHKERALKNTNIGHAKTEVTIDFTEFPTDGKALYSLIGVEGQGTFEFRSDTAIKLHHVALPVGLYKATWVLYDIKNDSRLKARMDGEKINTVTDWKNSTITYDPHYPKGVYKFT